MNVIARLEYELAYYDSAVHRFNHYTMICSKRRIDAEMKKVTDIFLRNGYPDNVISSSIRLTISQFNCIKSFGPSKCPAYVKLPWIGLVSRLLLMRCAVFNPVKMRTIFITRPAFQSFQKDVLPRLHQSQMVYKFQCQCNANYIGRTIQRPEVRVRQHVPRDLLRRFQNTTSGSS